MATLGVCSADRLESAGSQGPSSFPSLSASELHNRPKQMALVVTKGLGTMLWKEFQCVPVGLELLSPFFLSYVLRAGCACEGVEHKCS